jgi:hypothetical protein
MWVFDGEDWMKEEGAAIERKPETSRPAWDETMPELQVIEHRPPARPANVPPMTIP